jgi:hypothetical protein
MTHDDKRNGATTLFAALDILDGTVVGRCMPKHRHQDTIRFLNGLDHVGPAVFEKLAELRNPNESVRSDFGELFMTDDFIEA